MKKVLFLVFGIAFTLTVSAQISFNEDTVKMSKGENNSFTMKLPTDNSKMIREDWVKYMKSFKGKKTKFNKKTGEYFSDNANINYLSENTIDVFAKVKGNVITVWYNLGGAYLNSEMHSEKISGVEKMLNGFHFNLSRSVAEADFKAQEKEMIALQDDLKKLEKENKDLHETIAKAKKAIAEAEAKIKTNLEGQTVKKEEISEQGTVVIEAKNRLASFGSKKSRR